MEAKISQIKKDVLIASYEAGACHIGSALSCVDILVNLFYVQKIKPEQFLFSKASGVATYYAILADLEYFPKEKLAEYLKNYPLPSTEVKGVIHSFGSLGHGLPVACGMALGDRNTEYYVLLSDGELQEGSTLEACLFVAKHELKNLHIIVDYNRLQALGIVSDILLPKFPHNFLNGMGLWCNYVNGHNEKELTLAFREQDSRFFNSKEPNISLCITVKGWSIDFMAGDNSWHYRNLDKEHLEKALCQI